MMEGTIYIGCYVYEYDEGASQRIQRQTSRTPIENLSYQQKLAQAGVGGIQVYVTTRRGEAGGRTLRGTGGEGIQVENVAHQGFVASRDMKSFARRRMKT